MHSDRGFDVFQGDHILFQDNVFYDVKYFGIIKNFRDGIHDLTFRHNTFYQSSGPAGIVWDKNQSGTFSGIVWLDNVFFETKGSAIAWRGAYDKAIWDEHGNVSFRVTDGPRNHSFVSGPLSCRRIPVVDARVARWIPASRP